MPFDLCKPKSIESPHSPPNDGPTNAVINCSENRSLAKIWTPIYEGQCSPAGKPMRRLWPQGRALISSH